MVSGKGFKAKNNAFFFYLNNTVWTKQGKKMIEMFLF